MRFFGAGRESYALSIPARLTIRLCEKHAFARPIIHQPYYNLFGRQAETEVLPTAGREGVGVIAFCPLAQGLLTRRYLDGIPKDSRAASPGGDWLRSTITEAAVAKARALDAIARRRGQNLAQMALAWLLKDSRVTSVLIGASSPEQVRENVGCLAKPDFSKDELAEIDVVCAR